MINNNNDNNNNNGCKLLAHSHLSLAPLSWDCTTVEQQNINIKQYGTLKITCLLTI